MLLWCCHLQKQLDVETFGPNLADVEKQIAAHNILHQAIQSYSAQLTPDSITSQVHYIQKHTHNIGSFLFKKYLYWRPFIKELQIILKMWHLHYYELLHLTQALLMFRELFTYLCDIVSSLFLKEQYTTLKDKYAKLYVSSVFQFRVKRPHFINAHREMMVVYVACLVCRRAPSRGEATWPLCMNTCRAAVKSWCICQGSRRGSCRETGATSCLTLPASAWSMRWAAPDDELTADGFI